MQNPDYPNQNDMMMPTLKAIAEMGGSIHFSYQGKDLEEKLADHYRLSKEQREKTDSGSNSRGKRAWRNHIQYVRLKLVHAGLLDGSDRDVWRITQDGSERLADWHAGQLAQNPSSRKDRVTIEKAFTIQRGPVTLVNEDEASRFPEGAKKYALHRKYERDSNVPRLVKQRRLVEAGDLPCDVCGFSFSKRYGEAGVGFIEAHHTIPVSTLGASGYTRFSDIALVCSNCHRMLHRKRPWLKMDELKTLLVRRARARILNNEARKIPAV